MKILVNTAEVHKFDKSHLKRYLNKNSFHSIELSEKETNGIINVIDYIIDLGLIDFATDLTLKELKTLRKKMRNDGKL